MDATREHDSREALVLAAQRGDPGARDELVQAFLPLVASVARTYRHVRAVDRGGEDESGLRLEDMLSDPRAEDAYDDAVSRQGVEAIPALMACLDERERMVTQARYGLGASPPVTQAPCQ